MNKKCGLIEFQRWTHAVSLQEPYNCMHGVNPLFFKKIKILFLFFISNTSLVKK